MPSRERKLVRNVQPTSGLAICSPTPDANGGREDVPSTFVTWLNFSRVLEWHLWTRRCLSKLPIDNHNSLFTRFISWGVTLLLASLRTSGRGDYW